MYGSGDWLQPKHPTAGFLPPRDFLDCCCVSRSIPDQEHENRDRWTQCQVRARALLLVCRALLSQFSLAALVVPFLDFLMHQCAVPACEILLKIFHSTVANDGICEEGYHCR